MVLQHSTFSNKQIIKTESLEGDIGFNTLGQWN
jgi:hypothetical protein